MAWQRAWQAARTVYYERRPPKLEGVLFYHSKYIKPSWARGKKPVAKIGKHIFYK
jgi:spore germination cell wall hydrolase CwlJ-like protein